MNQQTEVIESFSAEETYALGEKIGQEAKPGQVYTPIEIWAWAKPFLPRESQRGLA